MALLWRHLHLPSSLQYIHSHQGTCVSCASALLLPMLCELPLPLPSVRGDWGRIGVSGGKQLKFAVYSCTFRSCSSRSQSSICRLCLIGGSPCHHLNSLSPTRARKASSNSFFSASFLARSWQAKGMGGQSEQWLCFLPKAAAIQKQLATYLLLLLSQCLSSTFSFFLL